MFRSVRAAIACAKNFNLRHDRISSIGVQFFAAHRQWPICEFLRRIKFFFAARSAIIFFGRWNKLALNMIEYLLRFSNFRCTANGRGSPEGVEAFRIVHTGLRRFFRFFCFFFFFSLSRFFLLQKIPPSLEVAVFVEIEILSTVRNSPEARSRGH